MMTQRADETVTRISVDPARPTALLEGVRAALEKGADDDPVVVDFRRVSYADPALLETLATAWQEARAAGCEIWIDGVGPSVYKALQIAQLGGLRRLSIDPR